MSLRAGAAAGAHFLTHKPHPSGECAERQFVNPYTTFIGCETFMVQCLCDLRAEVTVVFRAIPVLGNRQQHVN